MTEACRAPRPEDAAADASQPAEQPLSAQGANLGRIKPLPPKDLGEDACYRIPLPKKSLLWTTSGAWAPDGQSLWVPDVLSGQIIELSVRGTITKLPDIHSTKGELPPHARAKPSKIRVSDGSYLVEEEERDEIIVYRGETGSPVLTSIKKKRMSASQLMTIYDWVPIGNGILAFGDLNKLRTADWESAFLYFGGDHERILFRLPVESPARIYYQRNLPYVAAHNDTGYILFFGEETKIIEAQASGEGGWRELAFFPADFSRAPPIKRIPGFHGTLEATSFYKLVERSTMAVGIFAWEDHLHLLAKKAMDEDGNTDWWLIRIDPADGQELSRTRLPTQAAHLTAVPGLFWAFIEKDPVEPQGQGGSPRMAIQAMTLMPGKWLSDGPTQKSVTTCVPIS